MKRVSMIGRMGMVAALLAMATLLVDGQARGQIGIGGGGGGGIGIGGGGPIGGGGRVGGGIRIPGTQIPGTQRIVPNVPNRIGGQIRQSLGIPPGFNVMQRGTLGVAVDDSGNRLSLLNVYANSAAQAAGLQSGDTILSVNGNPITTHASLNAQLAAAANAGELTTVTYLRNGQQYTAQVDLSGNARGMLNQTLAWPSINLSQPGTLGVGFTDVANAMVIAHVYANSAAQLGGLQVGDQILTVNGAQITSHSQLNAQLQAAAAAGAPASITYSRNGQVLTANVNLAGAARAGVVNSNPAVPLLNLSQRATLGVGIDEAQGRVTVIQVFPGSAAARAGLQVGDQIITVNGQEISAHRDLNTQLQAAVNADGWATIGYVRNGENLVTRVNLAATAQTQVP